MKTDIILAGVGGQGVLSVSAILAEAAMREGLFVRQSEVHGMSQRGGAVTAHLRMSDAPIASALVPRGCARLVLSLEPLESLRHQEWLRPQGIIVSASTPVANIAAYPPIADVIAAIERVYGSLVVDADRIARAAGSARAANMVLVGAATPSLPLDAAAIESCIEARFRARGAGVVDVNLRAFRAGLAAARATATVDGASSPLTVSPCRS